MPHAHGEPADATARRNTGKTAKWQISLYRSHPFLFVFSFSLLSLFLPLRLLLSSVEISDLMKCNKIETFQNYHAITVKKYIT